VSDLGYYWKHRERLLANQKAYYKNLPKKKKKEANSNKRKKETERLSFDRCELEKVWK
jgi:hypothetical protein